MPFRSLGWHRPCSPEPCTRGATATGAGGNSKGERAMRRWSAILASGVALATVALPAAAQERVRFTLDWILQGPQATFLRAADNGCFAREKLDVVIDRGFGSGDAVSKVAVGNYDVGWADLSVLMEFNAKSTGPKALAGFVMHDGSSASILTLKATGITTPKDLIGKRLASPTGDASRRLFPVLAKAAGFDAE